MTLTDIERRTDSESAAQALYDDASITVTKLGENIGAKVEGVRLGGDLSALLGAPSGEAASTAAQHSGLDILRVNARFHGFLFDRGPRVASPVLGSLRREPEPRCRR